MAAETLWLRQAAVLVSAFLYWGGVFLQARRISRKIGRSPNVRPRGLKEKALWLGWLFVIGGWIGQPLVMERSSRRIFEEISLPISPWITTALGLFLLLAGYMGTLWCYAAMGDAWRMGIRRREKTELIRRGPYQFVGHPIYLFQIVMIGGVFFLLPTPFSCLLLAVHVLCVRIKSADEEAHLLKIHGPEYGDYLRGRGRFLPRIRTRG